MKNNLKKIAALSALACAVASPWSVLAQTPGTDPGSQSKWVGGYYGGYFWDNPDYQKPEHVDMTAMTHFVFARIGPGAGQNGGNPGDVIPGAGSAHTERKMGPGAPYGMTVEEYLIARAHHAGTKAIIMLGGEGDNAGFHNSSVDAVRPKFVKNLVDYMVAHDYDGIDVDWEGIDSEDTENQVLLEKLIADLRKEANARPRYAEKGVIITFPGGSLNTNYQKVSAHDIKVASLVDQYNIMSYAAGWIGTGWDSMHYNALTGHHGREPLSIASTLQMYVDAGIPRSKLGMGIGFYGFNYKPPFTAPGQPTDNYDYNSGILSMNDVQWNYTVLNKYGYLSNGVYGWDEATKTSYRSYPGGYTPANRAGFSSGYIAYEDQRSIQAKGDWAHSTQAGEGAAGAVIWLVNYGTTDGVNNPLLTAVKKGFLDPNAVEPGPNPNPLPPATPPVITPDLKITADWGTGYCADLTVKNTDTRGGIWEYVNENFTDTMTSFWSGTKTLEGTKLTVKGNGWNSIILPGETAQVGWCATRAAKPPTDTPPPPPPGTVSLSAKLSITADWGTGYCGSIAVTNSGTGKALKWAVDVPNVAGNITGFWNGKYTMNGTTMHLSGPDWNPDLAAGATNSDAGFCATR
ncbi:hypothetical protein E4L96_16090 [Massilia arenosa]|uniref:chitinase n=1 Tax=Zemynaea arenosa TaxID=2561931 RepID=A0A4Y9S5I4_9BURK|nr:glycosyl hydrolase family 18 protein [Massilia arenosa]TFW16614.1 hypothetical protein E4L96_16090 [Massilia arenosa]